MTVFVLKIIAMISMVLDHIKYAIPSTNCFATIILGRIAFPIFAFLISEGFVHTHSRPKYMLRMLVFAIVSQIPFYLFAHNIAHSKANFNVMFTFETALIGLYLIDFLKKYNGFPQILDYSIMIIGLVIILLFTYFIHPDYSWYGVLTVWIFYVFKKSKILTSLSYVLLNYIYYFSLGYGQEYKMLFATIIPLLLILFYNGKQGKKLKYFFYVFYPLHFIILYAINYFFVR